MQHNTWSYERERGTNRYSLISPQGEVMGETDSAKRAERMVELMNRGESAPHPIVVDADASRESYNSKPQS